jgi:hypothetical protein
MTKEYKVIKKLISPELAKFLFDYFLIKKTATNLLFEYNIISFFDEDFGKFGDLQIPNKNTFCIYGDTAFDTLLPKVKQKIEKTLNKKLTETYSYARIYTTGDVLKPHKDRPNCEESITLNLGGDKWPIYLEDEEGEAIKIVLKPGDGLVYKGHKYRHWRDEFTGKECAQVFLHYIDKDNKNPHAAPYDFRPALGTTRLQNVHLHDQMRLRKARNENN